MDADASGFPAPGHDHARCVERALAAAERMCASRQARLTPQRRRILEILVTEHAAVGAYEIIERLGAEGRRPAPITVYRVLDFLMQHGLVHRLSSCNAFIACGDPGASHGAQFLICRHCGAVAEIASRSVNKAIHDAADAHGFAVLAPVIEVEGICTNCRDANHG